MQSRRQRRCPVAGPAEGRVSWDPVGAARSLAVGLPPGVCRPTRGAPVDTRGETWVFVYAGLGGSRTVLGAAPSARGSGVHGEALGPCVRQGLWSPRRGPLNARPRGVPGRPQGCADPEGWGGPENVPSVRAAPGLLSSLSCTSRATHGARESWPGQEPRQARRQQPVTVLDTVVTHRSIIYAEFRFSLEWLKLESGGGHSVWQQG